MCEYITRSCLNTRKTIMFYVVCATCQNACACLFSLYKGWFWNTRSKSLPGSAASYRASSAGLWKERKLPVRAVCCFYTRLPTLSLHKRILHSQAYPARPGQSCSLWLTSRVFKNKPRLAERIYISVSTESLVGPALGILMWLTWGGAHESDISTRA